MSDLLGWTYFVAWSLAFYPLIWHTWRRKSVAGLSHDFLLLNCYGFACLCIYNTAFYIQRTTAAVHIELQDLLYGYHVFGLSILLLLQFYFYSRRNAPDVYHRMSDDVSGSQASVSIDIVDDSTAFIEPEINNFMKVYKQLEPWCNSYTFIAVSGVVTLIVWALSPRQDDALYALSAIKLATVLYKCIPQLLLNYTLKSTVGWSIGNVLLDLTGGVCAFLQLFMTQ